MRIFGLIMRAYSYLFHVILALSMIAISAVAWINATPLEIWTLPWTGKVLTYWLFSSGLVGTAITALAITGRVRIVFTVWAAVVFVMTVRGFFFTSYMFGPSSTSLQTALLFTLGTLLALLGSLFQFRRAPARLLERSAMA